MGPSSRDCVRSHSRSVNLKQVTTRLSCSPPTLQDSCTSKGHFCAGHIWANGPSHSVDKSVQSAAKVPEAASLNNYTADSSDLVRRGWGRVPAEARRISGRPASG